MAEGAQRRVQDGMNGLMDDLDKSQLRKLQGDMHRCSARCCDDTTVSMESVQRCLTQCSTKLNRAQKVIESELNNFQDRLSRCAQGCSDKIRDKVGSDPKESDAIKFQGEFERCIVKCADEHIEIMPKLSKKLSDTVQKL